MDGDLLMAILGDISSKLDNITGLLKRIESHTSGTESNTGDIYYVKSELEDVNTILKKNLDK